MSSVTFQAILEQGREQGREQGLEQGREQGLEQGRLQEAVALLFKVGRKQFGPASPSVVTSIEQITDLSRIEQLHERLHEVKSWDELLGFAPKRQRQRLNLLMARNKPVGSSPCLPSH